MKKAKDQPGSEPAELASLVGERIRKIRKEEGLSLEHFALRCDMNAAYVGHIERGVQNPTLNTLERICKGLDISVEDLFIDKSATVDCGAKLTLTSSRKWRKLSDGTLDDTLRVRYTCYGKLRKQTGCTGQTGYTVHILDEIIDKSVRQIFSKMRGIPKEQIITRRYEREVVERKNHLQTIQVERDKAQKDLISLKAEILACIKGESVFPKETLAEMITAQEEKLRELDALYESSYAETEKTAELMDNVSKLYEELISFSDLYDSASFEAKKMIVNQLIRRVDVYRGYQLNITFNFDLTPYIEGDDAAAC